MKETEITVKLSQKLDDIIKILENKGFKLVDRFLMEDYYFSSKDFSKLKNLSFEELIKSSFLLRRITDLNNKQVEEEKPRVI